MVIVSQDKTKTTESLELMVEANTVEKGEFPTTTIEIISYYILDRKNGIVLGDYKNNERAKEVLQEILKQKAMFELYRLAPTGGREQTGMLENFAQKGIILDTYEMPEE